MARRRFLHGFIVFLASAGYFAFAHGGFRSEPKFVDEAAILAQTYYYRLLESRDFHNADWLHPAAYDHQPVYKYVIGFTLRTTGQYAAVPASLGDWVRWMNRTFEPAAGAPLWTARLVMLLGSAFACWMLYLLAREAMGPPTGLIAAVLFATSPVVFTYSRRAMSDVLCQGFVFACLYACLRAFSSDGPPRSRWKWLLLAALAGGLAPSTKLNGAEAVIAVAVVGAASLLVGPRRSLSFALLGVAILASAAAVGIDPYYTAHVKVTEGKDGVLINGRQYPRAITESLVEVNGMNPLERARYMLASRREALGEAEKTAPRDYVAPSQRPAALANGIGRWSSFNRLYTVAEAKKDRAERVQPEDQARSVVFCGLSLVGLLVAVRRGFGERRRGGMPVAWLLAAWPLIDAAVLLSNLTLDWDRYYLSAIAWSSFLAPYGLGGMCQWVVDQLKLHPDATNS